MAAAAAGLPAWTLPARRSPRWLSLTPRASHLRRLKPNALRYRVQRALLRRGAQGFLARSGILEEICQNSTEATPMDIIPLRPGFGAELRGVTLADVAAHDAAYQAVRAAFEEYSVLVFRNQDVSNESQLA